MGSKIKQKKRVLGLPFFVSFRSRTWPTTKNKRRMRCFVFWAFVLAPWLQPAHQPWLPGSMAGPCPSYLAPQPSGSMALLAPTTWLPHSLAPRLWLHCSLALAPMVLHSPGSLIPWLPGFLLLFNFCCICFSSVTRGPRFLSQIAAPFCLAAQGI